VNRVIFFNKKETMNPFFYGMLVAVTMACSVGPGLILYFQAAVNRGFVSGLAVLAGLWASDLTIITVSWFGVMELLKNMHNQQIAAVVGATVLVGFGLMQWIKNPAVVPQSKAEETAAVRPKKLKGFLSGFFINSCNPFIYAFWTTIVGIAGVNFGMRTRSFFAFFIGLVSCAMLFDATKCFIFSKIKVRFNSIVLKWVNRVVGSALILAAAGILYKSFFFK
jgi:threonine/homoserine/homoserine lactone efflux protein